MNVEKDPAASPRKRAPRKRTKAAEDNKTDSDSAVTPTPASAADDDKEPATTKPRTRRRSNSDGDGDAGATPSAPRKRAPRKTAATSDATTAAPARRPRRKAAAGSDAAAETQTATAPAKTPRKRAKTRADDHDAGTPTLASTASNKPAPRPRRKKSRAAPEPAVAETATDAHTTSAATPDPVRGANAAAGDTPASTPDLFTATAATASAVAVPSATEATSATATTTDAPAPPDGPTGQAGDMAPPPPPSSAPAPENPAAAPGPGDELATEASAATRPATASAAPAASPAATPDPNPASDAHAALAPSPSPAASSPAMPSAQGTPAGDESGDSAPGSTIAVTDTNPPRATPDTASIIKPTTAQQPQPKARSGRAPAGKRGTGSARTAKPATTMSAATAAGHVSAASKAATTAGRPAPAKIPSRGPDRRAQLLGLLARFRKVADPYLRLCRLDRPIGYLLLLWPTWWALWASAEGMPPWHLLVIFTLGVIVMRSAGCVINDYADRWLDPRVKRTQARPLAANELSGRQAIGLFFGLMATALVLVSFTNALTMKLAVVGAFLAASYPYLKRYTHLPQIYLGVAFGWAIPMAFAAVTGEVPKLAWLLFLANVLWATAYDTFYAMVDRDDDIRAGAKSTAILFADMDLVAIAMLQGTFLLAMFFAGQQLALGWPYLLALAVAAALVAEQLWRARKRDRAGCFAAFLANHWLGMVLFLGLAIGLYVRGPAA